MDLLDDIVNVFSFSFFFPALFPSLLYYSIACVSHIISSLLHPLVSRVVFKLSI